MSATAIAHPNVALIKYWGKQRQSGNIPAVGSLSVTIGALATRTSVRFDEALTADRLTLNGQSVPTEQSRLTACLDALRNLAGDRRHAAIVSENDFPTGAGLASSASGYAALAAAAAAALDIDASDPRLLDIARIGSGSAPRSMFGGFVALHVSEGQVHCEQVLEPAAWPLEIAVAVTTEQAKSVTSRDGMEQSRLTSPYYEPWIESHDADLQQALRFVDDRDFAGLAELAEFNCLKMHSVMLTTRPPLIYWSPSTLACMHAVRDLRAGGTGVFFTVDAGPQVKAICEPGCGETVAAALRELPGVVRVITGGLGGDVRVAADA